MTRVAVNKTYKLFIGGGFPRSESGYTMAVHGRDGEVLAQAAKASRKDLRETVRAARKAAEPWAARSAYNRGQILYRIAEVLEARRSQFIDGLAAGATMAGALDPDVEVDAAIDRWVWYAGWTDKLSQVLGTRNAVGGAFFNISSPEPMGVIGVVAPDAAPLLGLTSCMAPVLAGANVAIVIPSEVTPLVSIDLAEVFATSDVPAGVINVLTGSRSDLLPWLAGHRDVDGIDATGIDTSTPPGSEMDVATHEAAADNFKRVRRPHMHLAIASGAAWLGDNAQSPWACAEFLETKTVWHPAGR